MIRINANIRQIRYTPTLCSKLETYHVNNLSKALSTGSCFLRMDNNNVFSMSRWVSPKRTRTYPYVRVYDTLSFSGKRVTVIPVFKDEGLNGDRDFLQWDTVSLMSLLGVYVIIGYYIDAEYNYGYEYGLKITNQQFDISYIERKLRELLSYQSDALHWNLKQLENIGEIGKIAINAYNRISDSLGIPMHSFRSADRKLTILRQQSEIFKQASRRSATLAQNRDSQMVNPYEQISGHKGTITIINYLGGEYHLSADEIWVLNSNTVRIVEAKHTTDTNKVLPSINDIKDALVKMILYTNLEEITIEGQHYNHESVIKLTSVNNFNIDLLNTNTRNFYNQLCQEAQINGFKIIHS